MKQNDQVGEGQNSGGDAVESPRPALDGAWYRVVPYLNRLEEVVVTTVTPAFVTVDGRRCARATESEYYEPTLGAAKARLIQHHELLVGKAASMLAVRERDLELAHNPQVKRRK